MQRPFRPSSHRAVLTIAALSMLLVVASGCSSEGEQGERAMSRSMPGRSGETVMAPDFSLTTLAGDAVRLSDFRGKVVLLDFWATWCGPCRMSIPHLNELYATYGSRGFEIVGVAVGDREDAVRRFVQHQGIEYVIGLGSQEVAALYGITSIPTAFLLDQEGKVVGRYLGYQHKRILEEAIEKLL